MRRLLTTLALLAAAGTLAAVVTTSSHASRGCVGADPAMMHPHPPANICGLAEFHKLSHH